MSKCHNVLVQGSFLWEDAGGETSKTTWGHERWGLLPARLVLSSPACRTSTGTLCSTGSTGIGGKSPSPTTGAQLFRGTAASSTTYSISSDADTWLRAQSLASNALAQAKRAPDDGKQLWADVLFVSCGEDYLSCFPFSQGRWGAGQAELHLTQAKCPCPHISSPTLPMAMTKPLAAWKPPFSKAMSPAAMQALREHIVPPTDSSAPSWPWLHHQCPAASWSICKHLAQAFPIPPHVFLCRLTVIYAVLCGRKIRLPDSISPSKWQQPEAAPG